MLPLGFVIQLFLLGDTSHTLSCPLLLPLDLHEVPMFSVARLFLGSPRICVLGALSVMLEDTYSWMHRRPRDLPGPLSLSFLER